jgi:hypothetical protein
MEQTPVKSTVWERLERTASEEMTKFERQETELRKSERQERAAKLRLPLEEARGGVK